MKNRAHLMALMASAMLSVEKSMNEQQGSKINIDEIKKENEDASKSHKKNILAKGAKEFWIGDKCIIARDWKNAKRKFDNMKK